jgi:potassium-transporting ATPase ATP-binding subunit
MEPAQEISQRMTRLGRENRVDRKSLVDQAYGLDLLLQALIESFKKFDPRAQIHNPVMFVVWLGALVTAASTVNPELFGPSTASSAYNGMVTLILLLTVWFANAAEALAEGRGKAKAAALRRTKTELTAKRVQPPGGLELVPATAVRKGDLLRVDKTELIPTDGEVIEGTAYVDESSVTGESAPVLKEPSTDMFSSVTAGTLLISDWLLIRAIADPGESFLDRMIRLVEGAERQKTPNEISLTVLLAILTLIVVAAMAPVAVYLDARINVADLIALLVALVPTTIGALLSAIGIAGIDRTMRFNVLAMSGKAVEAAGDVHTLILDKTGTITVGNRQATEFIPLEGIRASELVQAAYLASFFDTTPEGRTIVTFAQKQGADRAELPDRARPLDFSAESRMSGLDFPDGRVIRKGAVDAVAHHIVEASGAVELPDFRVVADHVARRGATPLAVSVDGMSWA